MAFFFFSIYTCWLFSQKIEELVFLKPVTIIPSKSLEPIFFSTVFPLPLHTGGELDPHPAILVCFPWSRSHASSIYLGSIQSRWEVADRQNRNPSLDQTDEGHRGNAEYIIVTCRVWSGETTTSLESWEENTLHQWAEFSDISLYLHLHLKNQLWAVCWPHCSAAGCQPLETRNPSTHFWGDDADPFP